MEDLKNRARTSVVQRKNRGSANSPVPRSIFLCRPNPSLRAELVGDRNNVLAANRWSEVPVSADPALRNTRQVGIW
jgi:hypothetical protein